MGARDPRVDAYVEKSAEFARPILTRIRETVHEACPEAEETLKWGFPHFTHKGILCSMAAFKQHCTLNFWKGDQVLESGIVSREAMGQFGRLTSVEDLPAAKVLRGYVKKAAALNDAGTPGPISRRTRSKGEPKVPEDLRAALKRDKEARATFEGFPPGQRREYVEWITEAKRPETRAKRLATAVEWLAEGKRRNWKYEKS
ncbi:MAG: YdeI/OmpD-associated family protein [Gemmatimonadota bacterium]|jgi:uncharacterized protein YdeI (YjbR/CyaY-like superfamily)